MIIPILLTLLLDINISLFCIFLVLFLPWASSANYCNVCSFAPFSHAIFLADPIVIQGLCWLVDLLQIYTLTWSCHTRRQIVRLEFFLSPVIGSLCALTVNQCLLYLQFQWQVSCSFILDFLGFSHLLAFIQLYYCSNNNCVLQCFLSRKSIFGLFWKGIRKHKWLWSRWVEQTQWKSC